MQSTEHTGTSGTSPLHLVLAWGFVGIPLLAGVIQTIINATQLFR